MKYYLSPDDLIYAYEVDGSQDSFIPEEFELLTNEGLAEARKKQESAYAPSLEQLIELANDERDNRLRIAGLRIAPLQDALDLGENTVEEAAFLNLWKQYRIAVNRVSGQSGFPSSIKWPEQPIK